VLNDLAGTGANHNLLTGAVPGETIPSCEASLSAVQLFQLNSREQRISSR
jgi:hypothetical protein